MIIWSEAMLLSPSFTSSLCCADTHSHHQSINQSRARIGSILAAHVSFPKPLIAELPGDIMQTGYCHHQSIKHQASIVNQNQRLQDIDGDTAYLVARLDGGHARLSTVPRHSRRCDGKENGLPSTASSNPIHSRRTAHIVILRFRGTARTYAAKMTSGEER